MGDVFDGMAQRWESSLVARTHIEKFSGGLLTPKTMANLDCLGLGPGTVQVGRKIGYEIEKLIPWMRSRAAKSRG